MGVFILIIVCLACQFVGASAQFVERMEEVDVLESYVITKQSYSQNSFGHAEICGPPNVTASLSWYPKSPGRQQDIAFAVNITAPVDVSAGVLLGDVYMADVKHRIFEFNYPFTCEKLVKKVNITCPIKKSVKYYVPYTGGAGQLPMGSFKVHGKIKNQDEEEFLCFKLNITVTD
ncbi:uncharacterized protein LOC117337783 isoform X1 [Pecten maximus]|uniref:uncharacterized protein LOC117337783 isoform X1 n=1 Tax=Pecten maximus TaxID=6579 RepID=UPI001458A8E4|nr:uncharacterized protein LOC117337783 isoform X1 [Pecten maximus]